jgi:(2Fe-2S) ferredoxin
VRQQRQQVERALRCEATALAQHPEQELLDGLRALQVLYEVRSPPGAPPCKPGVLPPPTPPQLQAVLEQPPALDLSDELYAPREYNVPGRVLVCQGSKCRAKGALDVLQAVSHLTSGSSSSSGGNVEVLPCKCLGKCKEGAVVRVKLAGVAAPACSVYTCVEPQQVPAMLDAHFLATAAAAAEVSAQSATVGDAAPACCTDCQQPPVV